MTVTRRMAIPGLCLLLLLGAVDARAEVSAQTDRVGNYLVTRVIPTGDTVSSGVWTPRQGILRQVFVLNPDGDLNGDLAPLVSENTTAPYLPLVVWSRFNGVDYDLAWARWEKQLWSPIQWVEPATTEGSDLDPAIDFSIDGRPHMVWWRDSDGGGSVYLSSMLEGEWSSPMLVSDPGIDSRFPMIEVDRRNRLNIKYVTPGGGVTRQILLSQDSTITDDINPQIRARSRDRGADGQVVVVRDGRR